MGIAGALANHDERLILTRVRIYFLIARELRLDDSVFYCLMICLCVEVCVFYCAPIKMVRTFTLYFICDPFGKTRKLTKRL